MVIDGVIWPKPEEVNSTENTYFSQRNNFINIFFRKLWFNVSLDPLLVTINADFKWEENATHGLNININIKMNIKILNQLFCLG